MISLAVYLYFLSATILNNVIDNNLHNNTFMRQTLMVTFLLTPCLFFRNLFKYSFVVSWIIIITISISAASVGATSEAFLGGEGVGYVLVLYFLNTVFGYCVKYIDKMYRGMSIWCDDDLMCRGVLGAKTFENGKRTSTETSECH